MAKMDIFKLTEEEKEFQRTFKPRSIPRSEWAVEFRTATICPPDSTTTKRISITVPLEDLELIQRSAEQQGLPYRTLIGSALHQLAIRPPRVRKSTGRTLAKA